MMHSSLDSSVNGFDPPAAIMNGHCGQKHASLSHSTIIPHLEPTHGIQRQRIRIGDSKNYLLDDISTEKDPDKNNNNNKDHNTNDDVSSGRAVEAEVLAVRRKMTFPHRRPNLAQLDIPMPMRRPKPQRSKSETHVKHISSSVTVEDLKNEWLEFAENNGTSGRFSLGVLVSKTPPTTSGDGSPGKEGLTLLHFDTIGNSELDLSAAAKTKDISAAVVGRKRHVAFADECGKSLCEVKVIKAPKEVPEELEGAYIWYLIYEKIVEDRRIPSASWDLDFDQPVEDADLFQEALEQNFLSLEKAYLENHLPCRLFGIVKVRNIAFQKKVFVRISWNQWLSYKDHAAAYQRDASDGKLDAFTFDIEIPKDDAKRHRIEFCICFDANGTRYWDNNLGENYVVVSQPAQMWWSNIEDCGKTVNGF